MPTTYRNSAKNFVRSILAKCKFKMDLVHTIFIVHPFLIFHLQVHTPHFPLYLITLSISYSLNLRLVHAILVCNKFLQDQFLS